MSGIVAVHHLDGRPVDPMDLARMTDAMAHRGPDGTNHRRDGAVGLGHLMLHTTPESLHETLPLTDASGHFTITADARLDNRAALIGQLGVNGKPAEEIADSELILAAYKKWGTACPEKLLGAFAFAIWDGREHRLFCAHDHLGVKNLYFWHRPGGLFACASEIKALLSHPGVTAPIDEAQVGMNLTRKTLDGEKTVYEGIRRLRPGHWVMASPRGVTAQKFWTPGPTTEPVPQSDEACTRRFLELFTEAVRCRLRSAFPVGSELSGGLDSSFVTCVARDLLASQKDVSLDTISLVYEQFPECDERTYTREITRQPGITPHAVPAEEKGLLDLFDEIYEYFDEGRFGGNHHLNWLTTVSARQNGLRVLLTGQDGDSTVYHGWQYFKELARAGQWEQFAREAELCVENMRREQGQYAMQETFRSPLDVLNAYGGIYLKKWAVEGNYWRFFRAVNQIHNVFGLSRRSIYRRFWRDLVTPASRASARQQQARASGARQSVPDIVNPDLAARARLGERLAEEKMRHALDRSVREAQRATFESPNLQFSFERIDSYAAACGIEARHPFMDKRLVEYCLALPSTQSMKDGWTRVIMRRAMKEVVPRRVHRRVGKTSLVAPYAYLLFEKSEQRVEKLLQDLGEAKTFINEAYMKQLFKRKGQLSQSEILELGMGTEATIWSRKRRETPATRAASPPAP